MKINSAAIEFELKGAHFTFRRPTKKEKIALSTSQDMEERIDIFLPLLELVDGLEDENGSITAEDFQNGRVPEDIQVSIAVQAQLAYMRQSGELSEGKEEFEAESKED